MRRSSPMPLKTEKAGSRAAPRTHRGESRQGIPGRVALQQSPLALPLPDSLCHRDLRSPRKFQRTATVEIPRVSRKGSPQKMRQQKIRHFSSLSTPDTKSLASEARPRACTAPQNETAGDSTLSSLSTPPAHLAPRAKRKAKKCTKNPSRFPDASREVPRPPRTPIGYDDPQPL
jgi:hypothetical protein